MTTVGTDDRAPAAPEESPAILAMGPFTRRALRQQLYLTVSFLLSFVQVTWLGTAFAAGASLLVLVVGLPVLLLAFVTLRIGTEYERRRIHRLTGARIAPPYREPPSGGVLAKLLGHVSDPATWRDLVYVLLTGAFGLGWFLVVVGTWAITAAAVTVPFWFRHLPHHRLPLGDVEGKAWYAASTPSVLLVSVIAVAVVWFLSAPLLELATRIQVGLGKALLGASRAELERREAALRMSRGQAVSAADSERRRIERDLHDGAQQRLVALAMDLGMAKAKLKSGSESDQDAAAKLVAEAHEGVKLALTELRDLARGIHPAVLTDRGLDAALSALAGRSPVPVDVAAALTWRPSPEIESAAYFVASEALANVAKHAGATRAWIEVDYRAGALCMVVGDDGVGGADMSGGTGSSGGTGLAGLADRVAPLDGILSVSSPIGGPTLIVMEIPCQPPFGY